VRKREQKFEWMQMGSCLDNTNAKIPE
jgi:hypothetical protein